MLIALICFAVLLGTLPNTPTPILPITSCYNNNINNTAVNNNETKNNNSNVSFLFRECEEGEPSHQVSSDLLRNSSAGQNAQRSFPSAKLALEESRRNQAAITSLPPFLEIE